MSHFNISSTIVISPNCRVSSTYWCRVRSVGHKNPEVALVSVSFIKPEEDVARLLFFEYRRYHCI